MKRLLTAAALPLTLAAIQTAAHAAPLSPNARNVSQNFSSSTQDSFVLLGDTDDPKLVYYIPRRGGIAVQSPQSANPIPRFNVFAMTPSFGTFAGMELAHFGGSFSTTSDLGALNTLQREAQTLGMHVAPAPANTASTTFMASGYAIDNGRVDVKCTFEEETITDSHGNSRTVKIPKCNTRQDPNSDYAIDSNVMYTFSSMPVPRGTVTAADVPFQAVTLPGYTDFLRSLMQSGGQWDPILTGQVNWNLKTANLTRQARIHVSWKTLFEQASAFAAFHWYSCIDVEVKAFFQKVSVCSKEDECGIRIEYLNNGVWGPTAPNDANFVNVVNAVQDKLQAQLFNEIRRGTTSQLGNAADKPASAVFTLRANYEKIEREGYEVVPVTYNQGPDDVNVATTLNISCLEGGFENGVTTWNMADPGCKALIGQ